MAVAALLVALALPVGLTSFTANAATSSTSKPATTAAKKATATKKTPRQIARNLVTERYDWKVRQYKCLRALWARESGWRIHAGSPSAAYGIPQAYPGRKMGDGWRHSAKTQITWGLKYIKGRYGTPCAADSHQRASSWY